MDLISDLRQRKNYLTTVEVMSLLSVTRNTLCAWVRAGKIGAVPRGNAYLFDPWELADWLAERYLAPAEVRCKK